MLMKSWSNIKDIHVSQLQGNKYLGILIDSTLTFQEHFNKTHKRVSVRLRLLERIQDNLNTAARHTIYQLMILPLLTYSYTVNIQKTAGQIKLLSSITRRAENIIKDENVVNNVQNEIFKQS